MSNNRKLIPVIKYEDLSSRQKENYNFHKVACILAEFGFTSIKLSDDRKGADFLAVHKDWETFLQIQLKGRMTFDKKYEGKNIYICFPYKNNWYLYTHDMVLWKCKDRFFHTQSWEKGNYHCKKPFDDIEKYRIDLQSDLQI